MFVILVFTIMTLPWLYLKTKQYIQFQTDYSYQPKKNAPNH